MPVEFDSKSGLFRVVMVGTVDQACVVALLQELFSHPDFKAGAPAIWDGRNADLAKLKFEDFQFFRNFQAERAGQRGRARIALVAGNELTFGLGRMFQQLTDLPNLQIGVFRDLAEAESWALDVERVC